MIQNPILPGFNPDPCIVRKGDDYYIVVSTFEWLPGLPVYHSRDLKHWELYTHILDGASSVDLRRLPPSKGLWAPSLRWCEAEQKWYAVYGVMNSMNVRYFDVNNYLITADDIKGPWSAPVYLHSAGFDASIFIDDDGVKYIVSLDWETREGYEKPGVICLCRYNESAKAVTEYPVRIWRGGTDRGCIEAPHLYKRNGWYYIICAEGGTGYNHCTTVGRAKNIWGPYEGYAGNPIITSQPAVSNERADPDHLKPKYFNPHTELQKSGHASLVETPAGQVYMVHLCSRPFVPELCCSLGRETAIQEMEWTQDGWLCMKGGGNLAKRQIPEPKLPESPVPLPPARDDFDLPRLNLGYYAPRCLPSTFATTSVRPGFVRLTGRESPSSLNEVSLLAKKVTSLDCSVTCCMDFTPEVYHQSAGLILYYDYEDYVYLRKYWSETLAAPALSVTQVENGVKTEYIDTRTKVNDAPLELRLNIEGRQFFFSWRYASGGDFTRIGRPFATAHLSDEYCKAGEFTGIMAGIICCDTLFHRKTADFDWLEVRNRQ